MPKTIVVPDDTKTNQMYKLRLVDSGHETDWIKSKATNENIRAALRKGGYRGRIELLERVKYTEPARVVLDGD
jgi:hypothetical protein